MEYMDLYDWNHQATGRTMERGAVLPRDCCVLVVSFWVRDSRGRLLLEQRSEEKAWFPLWWECGGGAALAGEAGFDAVRREVQEELGVEAPESNWRFLGEMDNVEVLEGQYFHHWNLSYLVDLEEDAPALKLQSEEVAAIRWFTVEELDAFLAQGAPVTKYTRRLYEAYRERLSRPMTQPGQKQKRKQEAV